MVKQNGPNGINERIGDRPDRRRFSDVGPTSSEPLDGP